jgi:nucleotide-binding universal stress UspA family protein
VVVAVDWSPVSRRAVDLASELARAMRARCVLVHVRAPPGRPTDPDGPPGLLSREEVDELAAAWCAEVHGSGVTEVETILLEGPPVDALLGYVEANPPDLLVFGRRGHSAGTRMLLGGISSSVLQHARCPVLLVP